MPRARDDMRSDYNQDDDARMRGARAGTRVYAAAPFMPVMKIELLSDARLIHA